jgi:hypothetical protein
MKTGMWCHCARRGNILTAADRLIPESRTPHPVAAASILRKRLRGAMLLIPKGYVLLTDAFNAVGRESYGANWLGSQADALAKLANPIKYKGPRSPEEKALIARAA